MRYLLVMIMSLMLAAPAFAANTTDAPAAPHAARKAKGVGCVHCPGEADRPRETS